MTTFAVLARAIAAANLLAVGLVLGALAEAACSPAQVDAIASRAVPAAKAACVLIRAFTAEGNVDEACATIDELAPLLGEILASREKKPPSEALQATDAAVVLPPPQKRTPLRRCAQWVPVASKVVATEAGDAHGQ